VPEFPELLLKHGFRESVLPRRFDLSRHSVLRTSGTLDILQHITAIDLEAHADPKQGSMLQHVVLVLL
jgi:hypothetical protein